MIDIIVSFAIGCALGIVLAPILVILYVDGPLLRRNKAKGK